MTKFDYRILSEFTREMYSTLLYEDDLIKKNAKLIEFKGMDKDDVAPYEPIRAYLLHKNNTLYVLDKKHYGKLPIRVGQVEELNITSNDVVSYIRSFKSFRINPEKTMPFKALVDIDGLKHTSPLDWTLWKIVCWAARLDKVALRVSGQSTWGKTGYPKILNYVLDKMYVLPRPKSIPGICMGITSDGCLVLDEMGKLQSEIRNEVSSVLFQYGDNSPDLKLGTAGSSAYHTKPIYDISHCSIICMYNRLHDYDSEDSFFDYMFSNSQAINNRLLPLRLPDGELDVQQFVNGDDMLTDTTRRMYIAMMKGAEWYRLNSDSEFVEAHMDLAREDNTIRGRQRKWMMVLAKWISIYSEGETAVFDRLFKRLIQWHKDYLEMVNIGKLPVTEEEVSHSYGHQNGQHTLQ